MLNQEQVEQEEELIRIEINALSNSNKKEFYASVKKKIKDPDTYAALNWFFVTGIHHFYLGKWLSGCIDLLAFIVGVILILSSHYEAGVILIGIISIIEFWALFRSQIIIQDWNNQIYRNELKQFR